MESPKVLSRVVRELRGGNKKVEDVEGLKFVRKATEHSNTSARVLVVVSLSRRSS